MKKTKTGVIGIGNMGKNHVRVFSEISQLVSAADVNSSISRELKEKYGIRFYSDYMEMLEKEKLEAISIAVPTKLHKKVALDCLRKKIPILIEKPIADNLPDATEILEEARRNNTHLMVGHTERFNPAVVKLKNMIDGKKLGKIINLLAIRVGISPPPSSGLDVVLDLAIHDTDVFNYLLGEYPQSKKIIRRRIFKDNISDAASVMLEYKTATGMIQVNWITPIKMRKLYVTGTEGFAEIDYINQKLILYNKLINMKVTGNYFDLISLSNNPKKEVFISRKEPLRDELKYFLQNRESQKLMKITHDAIKAVSILTSL